MSLIRERYICVTVIRWSPLYNCRADLVIHSETEEA